MVQRATLLPCSQKQADPFAYLLTLLPTCPVQRKIISAAGLRDPYQEADVTACHKTALLPRKMRTHGSHRLPLHQLLRNHPLSAMQEADPGRTV